ncbi:MAG TPA: hypothetical protein VHI54_01420 [Actinomycetota bacterium]|nr:hypothetical protein [Actinomycetota bacterium]
MATLRQTAGGLVERLSSERFLDPDAEVLGRLGAAFGPDDHFERPSEFGALQARPALGEVHSEMGGLAGIELPVKEMLDLGQHFVAANL